MIFFGGCGFEVGMVMVFWFFSDGGEFRERGRGVLALKKLNNFLLVVYIILMCCNVKIEHLMYNVL